jgi:hypothetical protein
MSGNAPLKLPPKDVMELIHLSPLLADVKAYAMLRPHRVSDVFTGLGVSHALYITSSQEIDRGLDPGVYPEEARHAIKRAYEDQNRPIRRLCSVLGGQWHHAFNAYDHLIDPHGYLDNPLHLEPFVTLPDRQLIAELSDPPDGDGDPRRAWFLLVLTARHEIGHFYLFVREWVQRLAAFKALYAAPASALPPEIGTDFLEQMHDRARTYSRMESVEIADSLGRKRRGHVRRLTAPESHLASLYEQMLTWHQYVYDKAVIPKICDFCEENLVPAGRHRYCSDECQRKADIRQSKVRHRRAPGSERKK